MCLTRSDFHAFSLYPTKTRDTINNWGNPTFLFISLLRHNTSPRSPRWATYYHNIVNAYDIWERLSDHLFVFLRLICVCTLQAAMPSQTDTPIDQWDTMKNPGDADMAILGCKAEYPGWLSDFVRFVSGGGEAKRGGGRCRCTWTRGQGQLQVARGEGGLVQEAGLHCKGEESGDNVDVVSAPLSRTK